MERDGAAGVWFYSIVNPNVDHPRWSQKTERRIGASLFDERQPT